MTSHALRSSLVSRLPRRLLFLAVAYALAACGVKSSNRSTSSLDEAGEASAADSSVPNSDAAQTADAFEGADASPNLTDGGAILITDGAIVLADNASVSPPPLAPSCNQSAVDGTTPPNTAAFIDPSRPVRPFYQWENNNGYCGEVCMMQAGMNNGQWTSQYNARLLCGGTSNGSDGPAGTPLRQSGPNSNCDQNAQFLLYNDSPDNPSTCLANYSLTNTTFDYATQPAGMPGYQSFLSWVKARTIAGDNVTIGVLLSFGDDDDYDHIVTVEKIGTNHATNDPTYYDDDVLYIEDHGVFTVENGQVLETGPGNGNPSIPPGTGADTGGCTPYSFGYSFGTLAQTAASSHAGNANAYSILIPTDNTYDYGFAVSGPLGEGLLPVSVALLSSESGDAGNPDSPLAGYNYETPHIGASNEGDTCTNTPPAWMTISLEITVSALTPGTVYKLYEYDFESISGSGSAAALAIPTKDFNASASQAAASVTFTATGPTMAFVAQGRSSSQTIVFRAVPASAP